MSDTPMLTEQVILNLQRDLASALMVLLTIGAWVHAYLL